MRLVSTRLRDHQSQQEWSLTINMHHACTAHPQSHPQTTFTGSFTQAVPELPA